MEQLTLEDIKTLESLFIVEMHGKPVKSNPNSKACKVDHIQCLCNGMMVYDLVNSKITK